MNNSFACHAIPNTPGPFLVDGFKLITKSPSTKHFFLSHFHGDHYGGLRDTFDAGIIYCTPTTRALAIRVLGVNPNRFIALDFNVRTNIAGIYVTLFDANHCPGAALLQFELPNGTTHIHTGDFRFHPKMLSYNWKSPIDTIFLDTTYGKPIHQFLPQNEAIQLAIDTCKDNNSNGRTLFLIGAYNIGKEKLVLPIGQELKVKIGVEPNKMNGQLTCIYPDSDLRESLFTIDSHETNVHVCRMNFCGEMWPFFRPNFINMETFLDQMNQLVDENQGEMKYERVCGIIPTGWAGTSKWNREHATSQKGRATVVLIPYSEHSSYSELTSFVKGMKPRHVEPIVFSDANDRHAILNRFAGFCDRNSNKRKFFNQMMGGGGVSKSSKSKSSKRSSSTSSSSSTTASLVTKDSMQKKRFKLSKSKIVVVEKKVKKEGEAERFAREIKEATRASMMTCSSSLSSSSSSPDNVIDLSLDESPVSSPLSGLPSPKIKQKKKESPKKKQAKLSFFNK